MSNTSSPERPYVTTSMRTRNENHVTDPEVHNTSDDNDVHVYHYNNQIVNTTSVPPCCSCSRVLECLGFRAGGEDSYHELDAKHHDGRVVMEPQRHEVIDQEEDDLANCADIAKSVVAKGVAAAKARARRPMFADTSEQAHPSDYIYVLTAMCSRLHPEGTAETIILALRKGEWVRGALRLFGSGLMSSHLDLVFARAPQIVQFFLPQLMHLALLPTSDRELLEAFVLRVCRKSAFFALLCYWLLCAQGTYPLNQIPASGAAMQQKSLRRIKRSKPKSSMSSLFDCFKTAEANASEFLVADEALQEERRQRMMDVLSGHRYERRRRMNLQKAEGEGPAALNGQTFQGRKFNSTGEPQKLPEAKMSPHTVKSPRETEIELADMRKDAMESPELQPSQPARGSRQRQHRKPKQHKKRLIPIDDEGDEAYSSDNEGIGDEKPDDIRLDIKIANKLSKISLTQTVSAIPKELSNLSSRAFERAKSLQSGPKFSPAELVWQEEENFMKLPETFFQLVKAEANFVNHLVSISQELCELEPSERLNHLKGALRVLNACIPKEGAFIPLSTATDKASCILRVPPDECFVFSTKERAPYMMCVEVLSQSFRWSSHKVGTHEMQVVRDEENSRTLETQSDDLTSDAFSGNEATSSFSPSSAGLLSPSYISPVPPMYGGEGGSARTNSVRKCPAEDGDAGFNAGSTGGEYNAPPAAGREDQERSDEARREQISRIQEAGHRVDPRLSTLKTAPDCKQFVDDRDSLTNTLGESWQQLEERIRSSSPHGSKPGWKLISVIVKSRDDLRQEQFAVQLITLFQQIFKKANLPVWLQPYQVLATSADAGLIQVVNDTVSLHGLKKKLSGGERGAKHTSLSSYFEQRYGKSRKLDEQARENFMLSLAAYSVVCYLLQIKDRHNGNILIDNAGHVVHIDYGFMLSNSPGNIGFEKAAFKLTREMVDVMGGEGGRLFEEFKNMCVMCYLEARKHAHQILMMVEITRAGQPDLPCFTSRSPASSLSAR